MKPPGVDLGGSFCDTYILIAFLLSFLYSKNDQNAGMAQVAKKKSRIWENF